MHCLKFSMISYKVLRFFKEDLNNKFFTVKKKSKTRLKLLHACLTTKFGFKYRFALVMSRFRQKKKKRSNFGALLQIKRKIRLFYNTVKDKQLKNLLVSSKRSRMGIFDLLIGLLESRLDVVCFRLNYFKTLAMARQNISHGYVYVNDCVVDWSSYQLRSGDRITVRFGHLSTIWASTLSGVWFLKRFWAVLRMLRAFSLNYKLKAWKRRNKKMLSVKNYKNVFKLPRLVLFEKKIKLGEERLFLSPFQLSWISTRFDAAQKFRFLATYSKKVNKKNKRPRRFRYVRKSVLFRKSLLKLLRFKFLLLRNKSKKFEKLIQLLELGYVENNFKKAVAFSFFYKPTVRHKSSNFLKKLRLLILKKKPRIIFYPGSYVEVGLLSNLGFFFKKPVATQLYFPFSVSKKKFLQFYQLKYE